MTKGIYYRKNIVTALISSILFLFLPGLSLGQTGAVNLDLQLSPSLTNAQVIHISDLLKPEGSVKNIYRILIQNQTSENLANLFLETNFESAEDGLLVHTYEAAGQPFELAPGEQISSFNTNLPRRLAENGGFIEFNGGLTDNGEDFANHLNSLSALPPGRYTLQINLYQGGNGQNGGQLLATAQVLLGSRLTRNTRDVYLTAPGDRLGSGADIFNPYPEYRWDGEPGTTYRLIVVEARDGQSPEALLQGAFSTAPFIRQAATASTGGSGSILDYEIIDARLQRSTFQTPSAGVQPLEKGKTYYWQLFTELNSSSGPLTRASEIWSFTLSGNGKGLSGDQNSQLTLLLKKIMGPERYRRYKQDNPTLLSINVDGKTYSGQAALDKLRKMISRIDEDKISFLIE